MATNMKNNFIRPVDKLVSIDKTWLAQILSSHLGTACEVLLYEFETLTDRQGFLSEIGFIYVSFKVDQNAEEEYLVAKCMPSTEAERNFVVNGRLAKREVEFYKFAQSELVKSVMSKSGLGLVVPDVIFSELKGCDMTIVMKNLKRLNYKTVILRDGSNLDQTLRAFSAIATIHAAGLIHFQKYNSYGIEKYVDFSFYDQFLGPNIEKLSEIFQGNELHRVFQKLVPLSKLIRNFALTHPLFTTVVHGDFWSGQCMYSDDEKQVCVLDWQFANVGNPIVDLMGMFGMSIDPTVLEENLDQILKHYWEEFSLRLNQSKVTLPCSYEDFVDCVEHHWMTGFNYIAVSLHDFLGENNISDKRLKGLMKFLHKRNVFSNFMEENKHKI